MNLVLVFAAEETAPGAGEGGILGLVILIGIAFSLVKLSQKLTRRLRKNGEATGFISNVRTALGNYANFKGRAKRSEYWWFVLFSVLVLVAASFVNQTFNSLVSLALVIPGIAVGVRRMHDSDRRGWWLLFPIVNLVLLLKKSDANENRFGRPFGDDATSVQEGHGQETQRIWTAPTSPAPNMERLTPPIQSAEQVGDEAMMRKSPQEQFNYLCALMMRGIIESNIDEPAKQVLMNQFLSRAKAAADDKSSNIWKELQIVNKYVRSEIQRLSR